ncbi:MAG: YebC/PmpR family DNA-binding transcriptional regulator [Candidatus Brocadiae bacterium]|nr:YebC/PmpR family DNA-binding transcriptional regulator [Candidatus Brocadiia bacterium]
MSGHSHWAGIKHKKAVVDAKRGKLFSRLAKEIIVAARAGGGNPDANLGLRTAIDKAKSFSVPNSNIERAIKSGSGEIPGVTYDRVPYEGYGPGGVAILLDILTDNRNRTAAELRKIFSQRGGNMEGSVAWMFEAKGLITLPADAIDEDELMEIVLEAGADDLARTEDSYEITTSPSDFSVVRQAILDKELEPDVAELTMLPQNLVTVDGAIARRALALLEELDDHDDVQNVYTNLDVSPELAAESG